MLRPGSLASRVSRRVSGSGIRLSGLRVVLKRMTEMGDAEEAMIGGSIGRYRTPRGGVNDKASVYYSLGPY